MKLTTEQKISIREVLKTILSMNISEIVFEKADGTIRTIKATRDADLISSILGESTAPSKGKRTESTEMLPCFDTVKGEWRGFSFEKIISVNGTKIEHLLQLVG